MSKLVIKKIDLNARKRVDVSIPTKPSIDIEHKAREDGLGASRDGSSITHTEPPVASLGTFSLAMLPSMSQQIELLKQQQIDRDKEMAGLKEELIEKTEALQKLLRTGTELERKVDDYSVTLSTLRQQVLDTATLQRQGVDEKAALEKQVYALSREVAAAKTTLPTLTDHVSKVSVELQAHVTTTTDRVQKLEKVVEERHHQTTQGFVESFQWVLDAHLENAATVAKLKEITEGADNMLVRKQLFEEAIKKGAEVATAAGLPTLADSWNELADEVGIVGDATTTE